MLEQRTVPGVYIKELNAFPNSVVAVETALPVFIGYTQRVNFQGMSLQNKPVRIESLGDYVAMFGAGPATTFSLSAITPPKAPTDPVTPVDVTLNGKQYSISAQKLFYMYNSLQLFFLNGGGSCYIMSIGTYDVEGANGPSLDNFLKIPMSGITKTAFELLESEQEPTMVLIPDGLALAQSDYFTLMYDSFGHCAKVQSRVTLVDAYAGNTVTDALTFAAKVASQSDPITVLRNGITSPFLNYGVAYYPWLNTSVVSANDLELYSIISNFKTNTAYQDTDATIAQNITKIVANLPAALASGASASDQNTYNIKLVSVHNSLLTTSPNYKLYIQAILAKINCLPATPAVAGCISVVDGSEGVWKAPANISLNAVQSAVLNINDDLQSNMNLDAITGKSVNAIRPFKGFGVMIWGARTLDGNSQDWRYVSVRRTLIMLEQSIKLAARSYVFEANDANTWINLKSEIENFLTGIWKQGGLAGSKPDEAFSVSVGLGSTMTAQDILDGYLDVAVLVAVTHPAEFIEISFKQQLQKS
ncbi:MAG: phage tail sheath family protein [Bacteroidota bacterium]